MGQEIITLNDLIRDLVAKGLLKQADVLQFRRLVSQYTKGNVKMIPRMSRATSKDFEKFEKIIITG